MIGGLLLVMSMNDDDGVSEISTQQPDDIVTQDPTDDPPPDQAQPTTDVSPAFSDGEAGYWQVAGVPERLNVRAGPGTERTVIGSLANTERRIYATGQRATINGSAWVEIEYGDETGWVSGRFLKPDVAPEPATNNEATEATETTEATDGPSDSRVCFSSSTEPQQVARIDYSDHTDISGTRLTLIGSIPVSEQITGTLDDGEALITLINAATGETTTETWTFAPASIRSGDQAPLAVVACGSIASLFG